MKLIANSDFHSQRFDEVLALIWQAVYLIGYGARTMLTRLQIDGSSYVLNEQNLDLVHASCTVSQSLFTLVTMELDTWLSTLLDIELITVV